MSRVRGTEGQRLRGSMVRGSPVQGERVQGERVKSERVKGRNRPEIRLNPVPAGFPASNSGSGSGPVSNQFAGFQPEFDKIFYLENLEF